MEKVRLCPIRIAPVAADALRLDGLRVEERLRPWLVLVTRHARCRKRRVDGGRHRGGPLAFRVAVLASGGEAVVRRIERRLAVYFVARDAFGLNDPSRFMRRTRNATASRAEQHTCANREGREATQHSTGTKPHGRYLSAMMINPARLNRERPKLATLPRLVPADRRTARSITRRGAWS